MKYAHIAVLLVVVCAAGSAYAAGPHGTQWGQPLTDTGQVVLTDEVAQVLADSGSGFVRVNFRLGPYTSDTSAWYSIYDGIVDRLRNRGLEIIGLMTNEARPWAPSSSWTQNSYEVDGGNGWNTYMNNWCQAFLRYATHWEGKIKYWELWNEPDCLAVIYPSNYGALLANCYDLARTNNVDVEIVSGGVCGGYSPYGPDYISDTYDVSINHTGWFSQMINKWGTYPVDHIGFHIYPNCDNYLNTTWLANYFEDVHNAYAAYEGSGTTKKMFLTEVGWMTGGTRCHTTEAIQAANVTSLFNVVNSKPYIKHCNWFFLKDEPSANLYFGLFRETGLTESDKKPSWTNFKTANTYEGRLSAGGDVNQTILDYFNAKGHAQMGNPYDNGGTAWVHDWDFGAVQDYDGGQMGRMVVCDSANAEAYAVRGDFFDVIMANHTALEFPLGEQFFTGAGEKQDFEGGYATHTASGGSVVTLYDNKVIVDNSDAGFSASSGWMTGSSATAYGYTYRRRTGTTTNSDPATWTLTVPTTGYYDVYVRYPIVTIGAPAAIYEVVHSGGTAQETVNQAERGGRWNRIGCYAFSAGSATVRLSSQGPSNKYLLADTVRLIGPVNGPDSTPPTTPAVTDDGQYTFVSYRIHASWQSIDMESGIDHYEYAVGTSPTDPGSGYLVAWTSTGTATSVTRYVTLSQGQTYYVYVRAYDNIGMNSLGVSDGITVDTTGPSTPVVTDDGDYTGDSTRLHCSWQSSDPESGIADYEYWVGTNYGSADVVAPTHVGPATEVYLDGLNLSASSSYYFTVRAKNGAAIISTNGYSDGITYQAALSTATIGQALSYPDTTVVLLRDKIISALFFDRFYLEELDRLNGIAVGGPSSVPEGSLVDVTGALDTWSGERVIVPGAVTPVE